MIDESVKSTSRACLLLVVVGVVGAVACGREVSGAPPITLSTAPGVYAASTDGSGTRRLNVLGTAMSRGPRGEIALLAGRWLAVMTDDGTDLRRLTSINPETEDPQPPAWAPDGRRIAVSNGRYCDPYGPCRRSDIWVLDAKSGRRISTIPYGKGPSWSPDGKRLSYLGGRSEGDVRSRVPYGIFVADARGKHRRYLARGELPAWSPRSDVIAYAAISRSGRFLGLHFVGADNGRIRAVASSQPAFAWSPEGKRMAFIEPFLLPRRLAVIDVPVGRTRSIGQAYIAFPRTVAWSPDGAVVAWVLYDRQRREQRLLVAAADGSESPRLLARVPRGHVLATPVFSSDGSRVLYAVS